MKIGALHHSFLIAAEHFAFCLSGLRFWQSRLTLSQYGAAKCAAYAREYRAMCRNAWRNLNRAVRRALPASASL